MQPNRPVAPGRPPSQQSSPFSVPGSALATTSRPFVPGPTQPMRPEQPPSQPVYPPGTSVQGFSAHSASSTPLSGPEQNYPRATPPVRSNGPVAPFQLSPNLPPPRGGAASFVYPTPGGPVIGQPMVPPLGSSAVQQIAPTSGPRLPLLSSSASVPMAPPSQAPSYMSLGGNFPPPTNQSSSMVPSSASPMPHSVNQPYQGGQGGQVPFFCSTNIIS